MEAERIDWIDITKGLGMILVMFGHTNLPIAIAKEIYSFHMPLFFFISGYLFYYDKFKDFLDFFIRKVRTLLIPYFTLSIIGYIFLVFIKINLIKFNTDIFKPLLGIISTIRYLMSSNGAMWFVTCLFSTEILFYFLVKICSKNRKRIVISLFLLGVLGPIYSKYIGIQLPLSFDLVFTTSTFFGFGYLQRESNAKIINTTRKWIIILFLIINIITANINSLVDLNSTHYGNLILFYVSSLSGIMAVILIIRNINAKAKYLKYIGKNSLIILAFHQPISWVVIGKLLSYIKYFNNNNIITTLARSIIYVLFGFITIIPIIYLINKYCPLILGRVNNQNKYRQKLFS